MFAFLFVCVWCLTARLRTADGIEILEIDVSKRVEEREARIDRPKYQQRRK